MRRMRNLFLALCCCLGLMAAGCDDKPRPGGPMPKASAAQPLVAPSVG